MRRTASGGGAGSFNATPPGADAFGVPEAQVRCGGRVGRGRLKDRKTLELVPGARHAFDVQRAPRRQADEAERPRRALCDPGKSHSRFPPSITEGGPEYRDQLRDGSAPEARAVPDVELEDPGGFRGPVHPTDLRLPRTDGGGPEYRATKGESRGRQLPLTRARLSWSS